MKDPAGTASADADDDAASAPVVSSPGDGPGSGDDGEQSEKVSGATVEPPDEVSPDDGAKTAVAVTASDPVTAAEATETSDPVSVQTGSETPISSPTTSVATVARTGNAAATTGAAALAVADNTEAVTTASVTTARVAIAPTTEAETPSTTVAAASTSRTVSVAVTKKDVDEPVTLASVVTDVLTWIGLGGLANYLPVPALPLPPIFSAFWLALRELRDGDTTQPAAQIVPTEVTTDVEQVTLADLVVRPGVAVTLNSDGTVDTIDGDFAGVAITSADSAAQVLNSLVGLLGESKGFASGAAITVQKVGGVTADDPAETFYRLQDSIGGIAVEGSDVILVTNAAGVITGLFNNHNPGLAAMDTRLNASIDAGYEAASIATVAYLTAIGHTTFIWDVWAFQATSAVASELVISSANESQTPQLLWRVAVSPAATLFAPAQPSATYYIYANGSAASDIMRVSSAAQGLTSTTVIAKDELGQNRTINVAKLVFLFFENLQMQDMTRNITTYTTTYGFFNLGAPAISSTPVSKWWFFGWNAEAVSAQANTAVVSDYYLSVLGLNSYDGKGGALRVVVNYNPVNPWAGAYNNAFWDPAAKILAFGDGADLEVAVDVVGHEYTHAVVSYIFDGGKSVGLDYGESGALNEAYADIMGSLIEGKVDGGLWLIAEDSKYPGGALRNLAKPTATAGGYRDNYSNLYTGTGDEGGGHVNSTIFSHAAYEMMTSSATTGISAQTWAKVFYHSLYRLSSSAKFADARTAVLDTATKEYGFTTPQLAAISQAFDNVGIVSAAQTVAV